MKTSSQYPLIFGFCDPIFGRGFVTGVQLRGRAVAEQDEDGLWWVYGVTPGALAESGTTLVGAVGAFRDRLKMVLVDYAEEAADMAAFKRAVEDYFNATDDEALREWEAARAAVRAGKLDLAELQKEKGDTTPVVTVVELQLEPSSNLVDGGQARVAA